MPSTMLLHRRSNEPKSFKPQAMMSNPLKLSLLYALTSTTLCLILLNRLRSSSTSPAAHHQQEEPAGASSLIHSAYSNLHARMRMSRSLQAAPEDPLKFLLVTGEQPTSCKTKHGSHLLMMSLKNKVDYCNIHACKVWLSLESWQPGFTGTWARYPLLRKLMLANPSIDWFMWMDSDALFTDLSFKIPLQAYAQWNKELIIPGYWDKIYGDDPDWLGLNAGIFLIRNTDWSRAFLERWMGFRPGPGLRDYTELLNIEFRTRPRHWQADDQSALAYLLRRNRTEYESRTHLESGYILHGFWEVIVDEYERFAAGGNVGDNRWPFITHFCGCKLCTGEFASSQSHRCVSSFRRAYNFADNQVLAVAGMIHPDLSGVEVQEI